MSQIRNKTLAQIAELCHKNKQVLASTIGCIVDITRPLFRQKDSNYIIEIKLIDDTFNDTIESSLLVQYLSVYLFFSDKEQVKFSPKIGDFIYLHKFRFSLWNQVKLKATFFGGFESVYQITGDLSDYEQFRAQRKIGKQIDINFNFQLPSRIVELKTWLVLEFKSVFNPFYGVKIINNYCSLIEPFTMILKVTKTTKNEFEHHLFLTDSNKNSFYLDMSPFKHMLFQERQWLFLRGIRYIATDHQIVLTSTGNIIHLPQAFESDFEKQANYEAIYRKTSKLEPQKKETTSLTYISLMQQKVSTVKQLFDLQDKYKATTKKEDIILQNNYLIKVTLVKYKGKIKLYHTNYEMILHNNFLNQLTTQQKKSIIEQKKLSYVYEGELYVMDKSISYKREILKVKIFTTDSKSTFFDQQLLEKLTPFIGESRNQKEIQQSLNRIHSKLEKLKTLSSFQTPASLVLEPIRSDELIYRLINTKIS